MNKLAMISLVAAMAAAAPSGALAGDVGCVWRALPESARALSLTQYAKDVETIFDGGDEEAMGAAIVKCVSLPKSERAAGKVAETVGMALGGYVMQLGAEAYLQRELRISPTSLEQAYGAIDPKRRRDLSTLFDGKKKIADATFVALFEAIKSVYPSADFDKLPDQPAFAHFIYYFGGRSVREQNEAKF